LLLPLTTLNLKIYWFKKIVLFKINNKPKSVALSIATEIINVYDKKYPYNSFKFKLIKKKQIIIEKNNNSNNNKIQTGDKILSNKFKLKTIQLVIINNKKILFDKLINISSKFSRNKF
jgi:hypothetical protein